MTRFLEVMIETMIEHVGLYGGSFDPIHVGHLTGAKAVAHELGLQRVILIPSARPPHKRDRLITAAEHRLAMVRLAVADDPLFEVSDLELHRDGPSYTYDTVMEFRQRLGSDSVTCWIIGADTLPELTSWYRVHELLSLVRIVTMTRPGWKPPTVESLAPALGHSAAAQLLRDCLVTPEVDVSASQIRELVRSGANINDLVHPAVKSYIDVHGLYRDASHHRSNP